MIVNEAVGHDIELHFFPAKELRKPEQASFAEYIIENGVPLTK